MQSELPCSDRPSWQRHFVVAHRAGNDLADLRAAEGLGNTVVEADVLLHRGRLEVRHPRTLGPLPISLEGLRRRGRSRLTLPELLAATSPETELMLDLKGSKRRIGDEVLRAIEPGLGSRRFTICARSWRLLEPFEGKPVRRVYSIGTRRQLRCFLERFAGERLDGVSIHAGLLHAESTASLRAIATVLMTWPVEGPTRARELLRLGVDGLITDDAAVLSGLVVPAATG